MKAVCSQQRVFGREFLDLQAGYTGQRYKADLPRITVDISAVPDGKAADTGGKAAAVQAQAQRIAEYFGAMRAAGHSLSDMVLLLGVTTNAQIYAQALRKAGFACVIAGGSLFAKAPEVRNIAHVARALVDPHETDALFNVLSGPLFGLSADDFLQLSTGVSEETGQPVKRDLCRGFRAIACGLRGPEGAELRAALPGLSQAVWTLDNAMRSLRWQPLSQALQQVLQASG